MSIKDQMQNAANNSSNGAGWGNILKIGAVLITAAALAASGDGAEAQEIVSEAFRK